MLSAGSAEADLADLVEAEEEELEVVEEDAAEDDLAEPGGPCAGVPGSCAVKKSVAGATARGVMQPSKLRLSTRKFKPARKAESVAAVVTLRCGQ